MYSVTMRSKGQTSENYLYHDGFIDPTDKVLTPKLTFEDNKAGSLNFKIPPVHPYYSNVTNEIFTATVYIYRDTKNIWQGRIVSEEKDFVGNKEVHVEGAMAYFNDTFQPDETYTGTNNEGITLDQFIGYILEWHNYRNRDHSTPRVPAERMIYKGAIDTALNPVDPDATTIVAKKEIRYTDYEKTMDVLGDLIDMYGGHMYITIGTDGKPYLNYQKKALDRPLDITNNQVINFGENLLDYAEVHDYSEFASVLLPFGDSEDSDDENHSNYVDLEDLPSGTTIPSGFSRFGKYLIKTDEFNAFGWVCRNERWSDITDPKELLKEAVRFMKDLQNNLITLSVRAVDLHYLDTNINAFNFLDIVNVISVPHGLNKNFLVTKLSVSIDDPSQSEIELGAVVSSPISKTVSKNTSQYGYKNTSGGSLTVMSAEDINNATPW